MARPIQAAKDTHPTAIAPKTITSTASPLPPGVPACQRTHASLTATAAMAASVSCTTRRALRWRGSGGEPRLPFPVMALFKRLLLLGALAGPHLEPSALRFGDFGQDLFGGERVTDIRLYRRGRKYNTFNLAG